MRALPNEAHFPTHQIPARRTKFSKSFDFHSLCCLFSFHFTSIFACTQPNLSVRHINNTAVRYSASLRGAQRPPLDPRLSTSTNPGWPAPAQTLSSSYVRLRAEAPPGGAARITPPGEASAPGPSAVLTTRLTKYSERRLITERIDVSSDMSAEL